MASVYSSISLQSAYVCKPNTARKPHNQHYLKRRTISEAAKEWKNPPAGEPRQGGPRRRRFSGRRFWRICGRGLRGVWRKQRREWGFGACEGERRKTTTIERRRWWRRRRRFCWCSRREVFEHGCFVDRIPFLSFYASTGFPFLC